MVREELICHTERHMPFRSTGTMDFRAFSIPSPPPCTVMYRSGALDDGMCSSRTWEEPPIQAPQALLGRTSTSFSWSERWRPTRTTSGSSSVRVRSGIKPRRGQTGMLLAKRSVAKRSMRKTGRGRGVRAQWARCLTWQNKALQPLISKPKRTGRRRYRVEAAFHSKRIAFEKASRRWWRPGS